MASPQVAFVPETRVARARLEEGALSGLSFAVKDVFAIRGHRTTAGHPEWARTHEPARSDARVVEQLLRAGAALVGVTILDELAYSLSGENPHYGTPENPAAAGRLCGGSSCGSAAAVAACLCDFAIGTDTAGSIRVPAAYCGLYGLRPSHGRISAEGVVPLAPSFDTVGFLARSASTLASVASVLLESEVAPPKLERVLIAEDAFALCDAGVAELQLDVAERALEALGVKVERRQIVPDLVPEGFAALRAAHQRLSARETWRAHGAWVEAVQPRFSPAVQARFERARALSESDSEGEGEGDDPLRARLRARLRASLRAWLPPGTVLFLPPAPGVAPYIDTPLADLEAHRMRTLELTCLASLSGLPQLVVPVRELDGAPLGLSFISAEGSDLWLAQLAASLDRVLTS